MSTVFIDKNTRAEADAVARIWRIQFDATHDITVREMGTKWRTTRTPKVAGGTGAAVTTATATTTASATRLKTNDTAHPAATKANLKPLLDLIGQAEANDHYNAIFGDENNTDPDLLGMSIDQVLEFQLKFLRRGSQSSACGRYQILRGTLKDLKNRLDLDGAEKFDKPGQDRLATELLKRRGLDSYLVGAISRDRFIDSMAMEWAALPNTTGKSHYDGDGQNSARVSPAALVAVVEQLKV